MRVAGIMSGTSLDGVDVAVIDIHGSKWKMIGWKSTPYPPSLQQKILAVSDCETHTRAISRLNFRLGEVFERVVQFREVFRPDRVALDEIREVTECRVLLCT